MPRPRSNNHGGAAPADTAACGAPRCSSRVSAARDVFLDLRATAAAAGRSIGRCCKATSLVAIHPFRLQRCSGRPQGEVEGPAGVQGTAETAGNLRVRTTPCSNAVDCASCVPRTPYCTRVQVLLNLFRGLFQCCVSGKWSAPFLKMLWATVVRPWPFLRVLLAPDAALFRETLEERVRY